MCEERFSDIFPWELKDEPFFRVWSVIMLTIINIKIYVYVGMFVKLDILQNFKKINLNVFFKKNNFKNDLYTTITSRCKFLC